MATDQREQVRHSGNALRRGVSLWARLRLATTAALIGCVLSTSTVPFSHEPADLPVPRRLDYDWMSVAQWHEHHLRLRIRADEAARDDPSTARIVWLGDSITEWWPRLGQDSWKALWQPLGSLNLGLGGDSSQHLLWRLHHGAVDGLQPEVVVLAIGTNNLHLSRHSDQQVIDGVLAVVMDLQQRLPDANLVVSAVLPRGRRASNPLRSRIAEINRHLAQSLEGQPGVVFVDAGQVMLESDGTIDRAVMRDFLHLTDEGYRRWANELAPAVERMFGTKDATGRLIDTYLSGQGEEKLEPMLDQLLAAERTEDRAQLWIPGGVENPQQYIHGGAVRVQSCSVFIFAKSLSRRRP